MSNALITTAGTPPLPQTSIAKAVAAIGDGVPFKYAEHMLDEVWRR